MNKKREKEITWKNLVQIWAKNRSTKVEDLKHQNVGDQFKFQSEESKHKEMKLPETDWPVAAVDEKNNNAMIKFIGKMRMSAIDLSDILLEINS